MVEPQLLEIDTGRGRQTSDLGSAVININSKNQTLEIALKILPKPQKEYLMKNWATIQQLLGNPGKGFEQLLPKGNISIGEKELIRTVFNAANEKYVKILESEKRLSDGARHLANNNVVEAGKTMRNYLEQMNDLRTKHGLPKINDQDVQTRLLDYVAHNESITRDEAFKKYERSLHEAAKIAGFSPLSVKTPTMPSSARATIAAVLEEERRRRRQREEEYRKQLAKRETTGRQSKGA